MKKSFRVATIFTGVAGCAAALAPTAQATPMAPGATARVTPDIIAHNCPTSPTNSTVLFYTQAEHHSVPACFASFGSYYLGTGKRFASYCGGAGSGYMWINQQARRFTAGSSYHNLYGAAVSRILISREPYPSAYCRR